MKRGFKSSNLHQNLKIQNVKILNHETCLRTSQMTSTRLIEWPKHHSPRKKSNQWSSTFFCKVRSRWKSSNSHKILFLIPAGNWNHQTQPNHSILILAATVSFSKMERHQKKSKCRPITQFCVEITPNDPTFRTASNTLISWEMKPPNHSKLYALNTSCYRMLCLHPDASEKIHTGMKLKSPKEATITEIPMQLYDHLFQDYNSLLEWNQK